ncbi:MAG: hypothetical protein IPK80_35055 [Nannocystis sp.]|nr:hypothetical protein [Nannocystis sp.]MBK8266532.1 hypothetical protein [Nannocystis sp.]
MRSTPGTSAAVGSAAVVELLLLLGAEALGVDWPGGVGSPGDGGWRGEEGLSESPLRR